MGSYEEVLGKEFIDVPGLKRLVMNCPIPNVSSFLLSSGVFVVIVRLLRTNTHNLAGTPE